MAGWFKNNSTPKTDSVKDLILDKLDEGLIAVNEVGDIVYANSLGQAFLDAGVFGPIDIVSERAKEISYEGKTYLPRYEKLVKDDEVCGIFVSLKDTVGDDENKKKIEELTQSLERAVAFKSNFLANMSHEVRTPIHAIVGFSEMMIKEDIPDKVKEQADMIKDSSYSLLAIINDVLDLSKLEAGKMELVYSNYYISYVIRDIEATYNMLASRKGIKFNMHLDKNIPSSLYGDKIRLRGILFNILNNAVKFTSEGSIDFYIHVAEKTKDRVTFKFEIKDTGIGIKKEIQDSIFEPFSKFDVGDLYAEGRGLGLSIAKGYLDMMGGKVEVKSEFGVGSTFIVTVDQKIVDDAPLDMDIVNSRKKKNTGKMVISGYSTLVVDDNPVNLTVADGLMKSYGLVADKASGGSEAIERCKEKKYDIVFMDQMMPEVDGITAMKEIRATNAYYADECKIVVLTADAMTGVRDRLIKEGFDEYLCKPLEINRLDAILRKFVPEDNISYAETEQKEKPDTEPKGSASCDSVKPEQQTDINAEACTIAQNLGVSKEHVLKTVKEKGLDGYKKLCDDFVSAYDSKKERIINALSGRDFDRYMVEIHGLKGQLLTLGATDLYMVAKEQEAAVDDMNYDIVEKHSEDFLKGYEGFINKLKGQVTAKSESDDVFKTIHDKIKENDFGGLFALFEEYESKSMNPETEDKLKKIKEAVENMDMEEAEKQLGDIS